MAACDQIADKVGTKIEQSIPQATAEQDAFADKTFQALQQKDFAWIRQHADASLIADLDKNPNALAYLAHQIPNEAATMPPKMTKIEKGVQTGYGSMLSVTYQYTYPLELVYFMVSFEGTAGSTTIKGMRIYKSMNPNPSPTEPAHASVPVTASTAI